MSVVIIVPAFNEEKNIGRVVRGLFEHGYNSVVVVDDGSVDATSSEAQTAGAKVISHKINRGQGAALQTGNEYAKKIGAKIVVHFDGDGQLEPADIQPAINKITQENFDVVLGSRFLDSRSKIPWTKRYLVLPISRVLNRLMTGVKLTDAHNGFRVFNENALKKICIFQDGMAHNTEIVAQIKENNLNFVEMPVEVRYYKYGQSVSGGVKIILDWFLKR